MIKQKEMFQDSAEITTFLSNFPGGLIRYSLEENACVNYMNDGMLELLGYDTNDSFFACTGGRMDAIIPAEELEAFMRAIPMQNNNSQVKNDIEHRIITKNKELKWVLSRCQTLEDEEGKRLVYCVTIDINNMKKMQSELFQERERYGVILSLNSNCFFEYDILSDSVVFARNSVFQEYSGKTISKFKNILSNGKFIHKDDIEKCVTFISSGIDNSIEFRYIKSSGELLWCSGQGIVIRDNEGNPKTFIGCINDINNQKRETEKLQELAKLDGLTRLFNKVSTQSEIENFLEQDGKDGKHALMIVDIDNFKRVNDQLGHLFGDAVLNNIAYTLKKVFYVTDIVGRVGGDEFVVFLKNMDSVNKIKEKSKEVERIFRNTYSGEGSDLKISCSMGVSKYPEDGSSFTELFRTADVALYQAKAKGKNCCELYDGNYKSFLTENNSEFYNQYKLDSESYAGYYFGKEITMFAFDILSKTKDVKSAVNLLIEKVGRQYDASSVIILEETKGKNNLGVSYCWDKESGFSEKVLENRDYSSFGDVLDCFDNKGICYVNNCDEVPEQSPLKSVVDKLNIKSMLHCAFYEEGNFKGSVCVEDNEKSRYWSKDEADTLVAITKIISFYLLKYRVSERIQEKLDQIKNYDSLTNLSTLHKFKKDANQLRKNNPHKRYAVVYSDISNFKYINDTLGYEQGDQVLCDFASMLNRYNRDNSLVARVSSDNFISMLPYTNDSALTDRVVAVNERFQLMQKAKNINCNFVVISGVCVINSVEEDIMTFIDNANIARKSVKGNSTTICKFYDVEMQNKIKKEIEITNSMEGALKNKEFLVFLQPKVNLGDNKLVGAEALVRWERGNHTVLPPNDFIPLFEKNGFILQLDFYIYEEVCKLIHHWITEGMPVVPISVNVSRVHLNDEHFVEKVKRLVNKYFIPPKYIELELTESMFLNNTEIAISTMKELRKLGFGVSIDDFGAGYSSLNLLKDMTTDVLKLDKEFFRQGDMQKEEQIIVSSIISMAKQLNMKVLSEGVETKMQSDFLKSISCDMAQGYLYAKPMPITQFETLLLGNADSLVRDAI